MKSTSGKIVMAGTPIGNAEDAPPRLRAMLETADIIAAEDTRRLLNLASRLDIVVRGKILSFYEHNESERATELVDAALAGSTILVITDAGMPTVSDPGYRLVQEAVERGAHITVLPGPSAVLSALAISGLPTDRFTFEGFLPRKPGERARAIDALKNEQRTMVFFESPRRLPQMIEALAAGLGSERRGVIARELTKTHEEVMRGTLGQLSLRIADGVLGEVTVVVEGAHAREADLERALDDVHELVNAGLRLKSAAAYVAKRSGHTPNELYRLALDARDTAQQ